MWSHRPRSASRTPHPDPPSSCDRSIKPDEMEPSYLTASRALNTACPIPPAPCEVAWHGGTASSPRCSGDPTSAVRRCRDRQDEPAWLSLGAIGHRLLARTFAPAPHASAEQVSETRSVSGRRSLELIPAVRGAGAPPWSRCTEAAESAKDPRVGERTRVSGRIAWDWRG